jgi:hypothetical protein
MHPLLPRRAARVVIAAVATSGLGACASGPHTADHVSTIVAHVSAAKASRLQNVGVVVIPASFDSGTRPDGMALAANGNGKSITLFRAVSVVLPRQLMRDGIQAEAVPWVPGHPSENARAMAPYDDIVEVSAVSVNQQKNTEGPSMLLNVRVLNHALQPLWEARIELRTDGLPDDRGRAIRQWGGALADDLCGLLMRQLGEDGFVPVPAG